MGGIVVWSEVFAACDDPSVVVRWSRPSILAPDGRRIRPTGYEVSYQRFEEGGCTNSNVVVTADAIEQHTGAVRTVAHGSSVPAV